MRSASKTEHGSRWSPSFILATKSWHVACVTNHHRASNIPGVRGQRPRGDDGPRRSRSVRPPASPGSLQKSGSGSGKSHQLACKPHHHSPSSRSAFDRHRGPRAPARSPIPPKVRSLRAAVRFRPACIRDAQSAGVRQAAGAASPILNYPTPRFTLLHAVPLTADVFWLEILPPQTPLGK